MAPQRPSRVPIIKVLPNMVTLVAICAGLTAIRFGYQGEYERAVQLILVATVLDAVDGRLARYLKSTSLIGAELDSLADFVNFGVAPGLILYAWGMQDAQSLGWIAVLVYAICCLFRLARFNVGIKASEGAAPTSHFVGVPSPGGALLVMLPMYVAFLFTDEPILPPVILSAYIVIIGLLMVSSLPTFSFKKVAIPRDQIALITIGGVVLVAAALTYLWLTLVCISCAYIAGIIWTALQHRRKAQRPKHQGDTDGD